MLVDGSADGDEIDWEDGGQSDGQQEYPSSNGKAPIIDEDRTAKPQDWEEDEEEEKRVILFGCSRA